MANYSALIKVINNQIKANGNQEITGPVLNAVLQAIVSGMSEGALFAGIADTTTNPPAYDGNVFYIAMEPGKYTNFGGVDVPRGSISVLHNMDGNKWDVFPINTYYTIDVDTLMQEGPSSDDIDEAIGGLSNLKRAIIAGAPFFGRSASGDSTVAIAQVEQLSANEVRVVMLNTGTIDGSNELVPIIKKITVSAGQLSLSTEAPTSFIGPLSSLSTNEKGSVVEAINEVAQTLLQVAGQMKNKQDKTDESLQTSDKTVAGAINEVNQAVKTKQDKLKAGTGVEITSDNTVNVTLDTTVFKVVASLPESPAAGDENKIHLVPAESTEEGNIYTEYVYVNGKWEEFGTYRSEVDLTPYLKKTDAEATYQKTTDNTLSTTAKTVVGAINENTGNVTRIDRAVGNPVIEEVDLSTPDENSIYWHVNGNKSSQSGYLIKYVTLSKGDLLIANLLSSSSVAQLTVVDSSHTKAIRLVDSVGSNIQIKSSYLAENDCTVALSYRQSTSNMTYIIKSPFNTAVSDNSYMQYLHKVYEEYGAVYNKETGYWELNGLTDLTEEDMWDIYVENMGVSFGSHQNDNYILRLWPFKKARIRFIKTDDPQYYELSAFVFCRNNSKLEVFRCMNELGAETKLKISGRATGLFFGCTNLKDAGVINVSQANIFINKGILAFTKCAKLSRVLLMNLKVDISFQDSPLLSYESLNYLITNAANTAAITVTVHPATYSYLTGTAQPTEEVGGTTEEWQALVTTAQGKQISFAQPAETLEVEPLE